MEFIVGKLYKVTFHKEWNKTSQHYKKFSNWGGIKQIGNYNFHFQNEESIFVVITKIEKGDWALCGRKRFYLFYQGQELVCDENKTGYYPDFLFHPANKIEMVE